MCCLCQENVLQRYLVFLNMKKKKFFPLQYQFWFVCTKFSIFKTPLFIRVIFRETGSSFKGTVGFNICLKRFPHFFELSPTPGRMCELLFWYQKWRKPLPFVLPNWSWWKKFPSIEISHLSRDFTETNKPVSAQSFPLDASALELGSSSRMKRKK